MDKQHAEAPLPQIVIISGSPGTGKSTLSRMLAESAAGEKTAYIEVDDFWQYIRKGYLHPWLDGSGEQNGVVIEAVAASAERYAKGAYQVFVAGTIGPWFVQPWLEIAQKGVDVRYIILRPDEASAVLRVSSRQQNAAFPLNTEIVRTLWRSFTGLGQYEAHAVDTTGQTVEESAGMLQKRLLAGDFRIE